MNSIVDVDISDALEREFKVKAGDTLYVPRGVYHDARSENGTSMQISLGIFPYYWCDVLHALVDKLADKHSRLRMAVAPTKHLDRVGLQSNFRDLMDLVAENADIVDVVEHLQAVSASKRVKDGKGRLQDLESLHELAPYSLLKLREIDVEVVENEETLVIAFYDKRLSLPAFTGPQVDVIFSGDLFSAETLPSSLNLAGRMVLIRKLITEGLVTFVR